MSEPRYTMRAYAFTTDSGQTRLSAYIFDMHYCYRPVWRDTVSVGTGKEGLHRRAVSALAALEAEHAAWEAQA